MPTFSAHESPFDVFQAKDLIRGVVITCSSESERIILSMKTDALPAEMQHLMKLGLVTEEDVPSHHKRMLSTQGRTFQDVLERTIGFNNPATASHMCSVLGIPSWKQASLTKTLHMKEYPREEFAPALRKAQSSKWAYKSLKDGVMHFKAGNHSEAFACLNKALQIDPENVEALVARGALFANNNNLRRALEDFEQALTLNPSHPNARKYMSETLVALGRYYEERGDLEGAVKTYKKAVKVNLSNTDAREALIAMEVKERKKDSDTRSLSSQASLLAELHGEAGKSKDTREKLRLLLREEVDKKHKKRHRHRSSSSSSWSSSSSSGASSRSSSSSSYKRHGRRHHHSRRSRKERKEGSKGERHRSSKKKRKSKDRHRAASPTPEEAMPAPGASAATSGATLSESYWKVDEPHGVPAPASSLATKAVMQRKSISPLSKKLAHLYEDEDEMELLKQSQESRNLASPKVTFVMRSSQEAHVPRLFNVDTKSAAASSAYYERKDRATSESNRPSSAEPPPPPRMESVVKRTDPLPERKGIEFKWKAVKKQLPMTGGAESHEEGSVTSEERPVEPPPRVEEKTAASSHEEGSIHSDSDQDHKGKRSKKDRSSSAESSVKEGVASGSKSKRKLRRRSRADSESYSSSGRSKSPVRRRRRARSGDHTDDYSTDRSSVGSRGGRRRRASHGNHSSDSSREGSRGRRVRYSSDDSREGKGRRRDDSYTSDSDGSHRRHSPMRRGGYRPYYYNNNRGGYYKGNFNNRRYNNYRGGYQNNRYFRGGRGGRRPFRPYYNNRTSPRSYYNNNNNGGGGGSYGRSYGGGSRDRRSDSETPQDRSFCPPWKRRNPIVSRAPDAEELKKLREAAALRAQEKQEMAQEGAQRINKATIIRNWLDDGDSRSPPRGSSSPQRKSSKGEDAPPLPPPLPTEAPPLPDDD